MPSCTKLALLLLLALPSLNALGEVNANDLQANLPRLLDLYKHLHAHPEISFQEKETSARIAKELRDNGFEVTENVGGYGLVGILRNGEGPTIMVRSDLDALPVKELTELPYASTATTKDDSGATVNVMHACGHDIHMTCLVGTAHLMARNKKMWQGTLMMIGQPAEERGAGAKAMIADGLFKRFPRPDYALALHVDSSLATGKIGYTSGYALANVDTVVITIRGIGGHGAYPEATKDPVVISAQVIMALQTIISRENRPVDPAVITVGSIHGGTKSNVIPNEVRMELTVRSYSDEVRRRLLDSIARVTRGITIAAGVPAALEPLIEVKDEYTPATYNDPVLVKRVNAAIASELGADNLVEREPMMGGEDFGRYGREEPRIPIYIFRLGSIDPRSLNGTEDRPLPMLHSSFYRPDAEPTIRTGVRAMTLALFELFGSPDSK